MSTIVVFKTKQEFFYYVIIFAFVALLGQDYSFLEIPLHPYLYWFLGFVFFVGISKGLKAWWKV